METRVYDLDQRTYIPLIPDMAYPMEDDRFSVYARIISTQTNSVGLYAAGCCDGLCTVPATCRCKPQDVGGACVKWIAPICLYHCNLTAI